MQPALADPWRLRQGEDRLPLGQRRAVGAEAELGLVEAQRVALAERPKLELAAQSCHQRLQREERPDDGARIVDRCPPLPNRQLHQARFDERRADLLLRRQDRHRNENAKH